MKKLLLAIMLLPLAVMAQKYQDPLLYGERKNRLRNDSVFQLPIGLDGSNNGLRTSTSLPSQPHGYDTAQLRYVILDSSVRVWTGWQWLSFSGGSSVVSWGDIIGTLSDQTDLQAALDNKWSITGNTLSTAGTLGSLNDFDVNFKRNNSTYMSLIKSASGQKFITIPAMTVFGNNPDNPSGSGFSMSAGTYFGYNVFEMSTDSSTVRQFAFPLYSNKDYMMVFRPNEGGSIRTDDYAIIEAERYSGLRLGTFESSDGVAIDIERSNRVWFRSDSNLFQKRAGYAGNIHGLLTQFSFVTKKYVDSLTSSFTSYTDEMAQDAVGGILVDQNGFNFTYTDGDPSITLTTTAGDRAVLYSSNGALTGDNGSTGLVWTSNKQLLVNIGEQGSTATKLQVGGGISSYGSATTAYVISQGRVYANTVLGTQGAFIAWGNVQPATITSDQNDYAPTGYANATIFELKTDASRNITGINSTPPSPIANNYGRIITIVNSGTNPIVLKAESASSSTDNRFGMPSDLTLASKQAASFQMAGIVSGESGLYRWRLVGTGGTIGTPTTPTLQQVIEAGYYVHDTSIYMGQNFKIRWDYAGAGNAVGQYNGGTNSMVFYNIAGNHGMELDFSMLAGIGVKKFKFRNSGQALDTVATLFDLRGISGSSLTLQQVFDLETGEALMNKSDTINIAGNAFHFIGSGVGASVNMSMTNGASSIFQNISTSSINNLATNSTTHYAGYSSTAIGEFFAEAYIDNDNSHYSRFGVKPDSIVFLPNAGFINIDSLQTTTDTTSFKPTVWNPTTGSFRKFNYWPSGGSGTPSLTQYYVGVGDASNLLSGTDKLQFNSGVLSVGNSTTTNGRIDAGYLRLLEFSSVSTPPASSGHIYAKNDGTVHYINSSAVDYDLTTGGTTISYPYTTLKYLTGYGTFGSFKDSMDYRILGGNNVTGGTNNFGAVTGGTDNFALGNNLFNSLTSGALNLNMGKQSLQRVTTGSQFINLGYHNNINVTASNFNSAPGITIGSEINGYNKYKNLGIGSYLISYNVDSVDIFRYSRQVADNMAIGVECLINLYDGQDNMVFSWGGLESLDSGYNNNVFGQYGLPILDYGRGNNAFGFKAGRRTSGGNKNTFIGDSSGTGPNNAVMQNSTFLGSFTRFTGTSIFNRTAIGDSALVSQDNFMALGRTGTRVGIGRATASEQLHLDSAMILGPAANSNDGTVEYNGSVFRFREAGTWKTLAGGGIGGSIAADQVAVGSSANTIAGSSNFLYTSSELRLGNNADAGDFDLQLNRGIYIDDAPNTAIVFQIMYNAGGNSVFSIYNSSGTAALTSGAAMTLSSSGDISIRPYSANVLTVSSGTVNATVNQINTVDVALRINLASSATGDAFQVKNSGGTTISSIDKDGIALFTRVGIGGDPVTSSNQIYAVGSGANSEIARFENTSNSMRVTLAGTVTVIKMTGYWGTWNMVANYGGSPFFAIGSNSLNAIVVDQATYDVGIGPLAPARRLHVNLDDAVTSAVTNMTRTTHTSTGTVTTGFGVGYESELENASGTNRIAAADEIAWTDATNATEDADKVVKLMKAGTLTEAARFISTGELKVQLLNQDDAETKVVVWNSTDKIFEWRASSSLGGGGSMATLSDVTLTSLATNDFLKYNGSVWINRTPANVRTDLSLVVGTNVQAWDADLDTWAGITPASGVGTFLATPSSANFISAVTDETGSGALVFGTSPTLSSPIIQTILGSNSNTVIVTQDNSSAINYFHLINATSGNPPEFLATNSGGTGDVSVNFRITGAGKFNYIATSSGSAELRIFEDLDNGSNYGGLTTVSSLTSNRTYTFPDANTNIPIISQTITHTGFTAARTITWLDADQTVVNTTGTQTMTNKRVSPRSGNTASSATPTINTDNVDIYRITAQTVDITSMTTNLSGTPTDGQRLTIEITGTASRAITWGASFEAGALALPTTTSGTSRLSVEFAWNTATSKWTIKAQW